MVHGWNVVILHPYIRSVYMNYNVALKLNVNSKPK